MVGRFAIAESSPSGAPAETWTFDYAEYSATYQTLSSAGGTFDLGPVSLHGSTTTVQISELGCYFDVLNWSFQVSQPSTAASGEGSGAGKPSFAPLSIMKPVDSCTPVLTRAMDTGEHFPELTPHDPGDREYYASLEDRPEECIRPDQFNIDSEERVCD